MRRLILGVLLSAGLLAAVPAAQPAGRMVVLVSIDGFAAFHFRNTAIDLPNIRALAAAGTQAASSETVFPSVTHPSHTTLITGTTPQAHGVIANRVRDRRTGERFHVTNVPRRESIKVPTLFDVVHQAGRRTAAFFWPETKDDAAIDDNVAEVFTPSDAADPAATAPALLQELRTAGVPIDSYYTFYNDPFGQAAADIALTEAAIHVITKRQPAFTALHLLVTDKVQHDVGPAHYLAAGSLTAADHCIGLLRKAIDDAGLTDRTTFVIAADHGFVTVPYEVDLTVVLRDEALEGHVRWHVDGWFAFAELLPSFDRARHQAALDRVLDRVLRVRGVSTVVRPGGFAALGYPEYDASPYVQGQYMVAADVDTHLTFGNGNGEPVRQLKAEPYHGHGYFPDHPSMHTLLVFSGAGIARGRTMGHVRNVDVAPTIAELLGVKLSGASGRVLRDVMP